MLRDDEDGQPKLLSKLLLALDKLSPSADRRLHFALLVAKVWLPVLFAVFVAGYFVVGLTFDWAIGGGQQ